MGLILGAIAGFAIGEGVGTLTFKKREYPPDIWGDYRMQAGSWVNSALVHTVALTLLLLPYIVTRMLKPPQAAANKSEIVDISPYLAQLPPDAKAAVFRAKLKGGTRTQLHAWFQDADGKDVCGAYYACVKRL